MYINFPDLKLDNLSQWLIMDKKTQKPDPLENFEGIASRLVGSFEIFMQEMIDMGGLSVSDKSRFFSPKDLFRLNERMAYQSPDVTVRSVQTSYPMLYLFSHLTRAGKFASYQKKKGKTYLVADRAYFDAFRELSLPARYIFLLEIFWTRIERQEIFAFYSTLLSQSELFAAAKKYKPGKRFFPTNSPFSDGKRGSKSIHMIFMEAYVLWFFGFFEMEIPDSSPKVDRYTFPGKSIKLTSFGNQLCEILQKERPEKIWNLEIRSLYTFDEDVKQMEFPPFHEAFIPLFQKSDFQKTLSVPEIQPIEGGYRLKISLGNDCYRVLDMSADTTLADLHLVIQDVFDFDNDHLFAFYMKPGNRRRDDGLMGSPAEYGETDETTLGLQNLYVGQKFRYVFDFGDHWEFTITVVDHFPEWDSDTINWVEKVGDSPEQYAYYEEDEED